MQLVLLLVQRLKPLLAPRVVARVVIIIGLPCLSVLPIPLRLLHPVFVPILMCPTPRQRAVFFPPVLTMRPARLVPVILVINSMPLEQAVFPPAQLIRSRNRHPHLLMRALILWKKAAGLISTILAQQD